MDSLEPTDKWNLVFLTSVCHGLGTMIVWNMFISAKDYFVLYKLHNVPVYSQYYLAYMGFASQIPNVVFNWINVFINIGGNLTVRILWSLTLEVTIFVVTIILAMVDSAGWSAIFFWITMISVFLLHAANAIFQNCVYGVTAYLPAKYTGGVLLGSNICGTLVVLLSWLSRNFNDLHTAFIYCFLCGVFLFMVCFDTYFALPLNRFYCYYEDQRTMPAVLPDSMTHRKNTRIKKHIPFRMIFRKSAMQLFNVFFTFFVTQAVYPAVVSDIKPIKAGFLGENFVILTCSFTFHIMAMTGNITASIRQIPGPRLLTVFTTVRILFVPFFLLSNYQPPAGRTLPVLVRNDYVYWFINALLGWSSGHASSLGMMYVRGTVIPDQAATAGMMGSAALVTGILTGLVFTRFCPIIVSL